MKQRSVILYIAMSLDGYIATDNDGLEWLDIVSTPGEDYGYHDFISSIDTVIMGRKTYDKVLTFGIDFPHSGSKCYVVSRSRSGADNNVTYYNGAPGDLIRQLKQENGKDIFIDGGGETILDLMQHGLIDGYIISVIPTLLGSGVPLFRGGRPPQALKLTRSLTFPSGLVQLWYNSEGR